MGEHDEKAAEVLRQCAQRTPMSARSSVVAGNSLAALSAANLTVVDKDTLSGLQELVQKAYAEALDSCGKDSVTTRAISAIGALLSETLGDKG